MFSVLLKWRRKRDSSPPVPYALECTCGKRLTGPRSLESQTIHCGKCGVRHFIFPRSPLARFRSLGPRPQPTAQPPTASPNAHFWRKPLWAAVIALLVLLPGMVWLTQATLFRADNPLPKKLEEEPAIDGIVREGYRALSDGRYTRAVEQFRQARQQAKPDETPSPEKLEQLEREAALLNDLVSESIPEILRQSIDTHERAWQERFVARYRHQSILFDALVQRTQQGYRIDYQLVLGENPIRLDLGEQSQLAKLSLDEPRRLLFGFRLSETKRVRGAWVVIAEPDSVVLMTESAALKGVSMLVDGELSHLLAEQGRMLQRLR